MAYGDLKVNNLIYDTGSGDASRSVVSIPLSASPTFTGVVTVPTPAAGDNTTKAATTAYVQTELTDYAPLASPALTGTATAVNLTLSGDLVVNGSTTTINSTNTTITDNLLELNSGASSNANDSGIIIERGSTGDNAIFAWDESADKFIVGTTTATAGSTGNISVTAGTLVTGTVEDSKGNVRHIPRSIKSSAYTLVAADSGTCIYISSGGVTVNANVFGTAGHAVTIVNDSGSDQTITQGAGISIYNTADASTGNRVLAGRGMATIWFSSGTTAYISGAGLS